MQVNRARLMLPFLVGITALTLVATACTSSSPPASQPTATPTPEVMMKKETPTPEAMMEKETPTPEAMMEKETPTPEAMMEKLPDQQFAAHFVDSDPKHGAKLTSVPTTITLNFNFTLSDASTITVTRDGKQANSGKPIFSSNKLTMTTTVPSTAGVGTYIVDYRACWPDNTCHDGKFAFSVGS